jgi:hypothetical protein
MRSGGWANAGVFTSSPAVSGEPAGIGELVTDSAGSVATVGATPWVTGGGTVAGVLSAER